MVINIGALKAKKYDYVEKEIRALKEIAGSRVLKVIIETCLLDEEEKIRMCEIVTRAGADYIKTSTGFSTEGATFADVELFRRHVGKGVRIKAAGGISSFADAEKFIELGASQAGDQPSGEDCQSGKNPLIFLVMAGQIRRNEEKTV